MSGSLTYRYTRTTRRLMSVAMVLVAAFCVLVTVQWLNGRLDRPTIVMAIVVLPVISYAVVDALRFRLTLTDSLVERRGFRTRRIRYEDIDHITINRADVTIRAGNRRIRISREVERRTDICREIVTRIPKLHTVFVDGDRELVRQCADPAGDESRRPG